MNRQIKKEVLYVLLDKWADWEFAYTAAAIAELSDGAFVNKTVSVKKRAVSIGGLVCDIDYVLPDVPQDYAAVILIGGMSWRGADAPKVTPLVRQCSERGGVLGGICDAARFLGGIGMLNAVEHTANGIGELTELGSVYDNAKGYKERQAVRDGRIITANGTAALEFAREVMTALGIPAKKIDGWYKFSKRGFYPTP